MYNAWGFLLYAYPPFAEPGDKDATFRFTWRP